MRLLVVLGLCALLAGHAYAAPTFDASGPATNAACDDDTTPSVNVTVGSGSNRFLVATLYTGNTVTITGLTFAAQTPVIHHDHTAGNVWMISLDDPTSGAQTLGLTLSGNPSRCLLKVSTFADTDSIDAAVEATGFSTTPSVNCSSATGDLVVDGVASGAGDAITVGAGQTSHPTELESPGGNSRALGMSSEAGGATVTMSWTVGGADWWSICANLNAAAAGASAVPKIIQQQIAANDDEFDPLLIANAR